MKKEYDFSKGKQGPPLLYIKVDKLKKRIVELEAQVNEYSGIRDQFNWQSEQDAQALWERDEEIAAMRPLVGALAGYNPHRIKDKRHCEFCEGDWVIHEQDCPVLLARQMVKKWEEKGINP